MASRSPGTAAEGSHRCTAGWAEAAAEAAALVRNMLPHELCSLHVAGVERQHGRRNGEVQPSFSVEKEEKRTGLFFFLQIKTNSVLYTNLL